MHKLKKKPPKPNPTKNEIMQNYLREMQLCFEPIEAWLNFSEFAGDDVVKPKLIPETCLSWVRLVKMERATEGRVVSLLGSLSLCSLQMDLAFGVIPAVPFPWLFPAESPSVKAWSCLQQL